VRKVSATANGSATNERIYLGGYEVYREYDSNGTTTLERQTLHVTDDKQRVALVETRTQGNDRSAAQLIRYQFGNHLASVSLELDGTARLISYEEYYSYGSTSYQAVNQDLDPAPKRYRFTAKERDENTGFAYHGARYYAPWLGRWTKCDPAGIVDGPNPYCYVRGNPIRGVDPAGDQTEAPTPLEDSESMSSETLHNTAGPPISEADRNWSAPVAYSEKPAGPPDVPGELLSCSAKTPAPEPEQKVLQVSEPELEVSISAISAEKALGDESTFNATEFRANHPNSWDQIQVIEANTRAHSAAVAGTGYFVPTVTGSLYGAGESLLGGNAQETNELIARGNQIAKLYSPVLASLKSQSRVSGTAAGFEGEEMQWGAPLSPPATMVSGAPQFTYSQGFAYGYDLAKAGQTGVFGKYPGNVEYVDSHPGSFTADRPWGWTPMYNAGVVRGALEAGGSFKFTSETFTGTFGLEAHQILNLPAWSPNITGRAP
jgi:RHS repeat-associated protein